MLLEAHGQKEKWDPAPQAPGDLVTRDMEKAEMLHVHFCFFFFNG